jgi:hypothetical protein
MSATAASDEYNDLFRDRSRLTSHPSDEHDDNDDARSFLNLSSDGDSDHTPPASHHEDDNVPIPRASSSFARNTIPTTRYAANTGPKGVISDAQNFRDSRRSRRTSTQSTATLQQSYKQQRRRTPPTFTTSSNGPSGSAGGCSEKLAEDSDEDQLADDGGDDEFMREWRQSRLREMQNGGRIRGSARAGASEMVGLPRRTGLWGGVATVDGMGFLEAVDQSPEGTVVVVYIYDDYVSLRLFASQRIVSPGRSIANTRDSHKYPPSSKPTYARWLLDTRTFASYACTSRTRRWSLQVCQLFWRIGKGRSLLDWCHW